MEGVFRVSRTMIMSSLTGVRDVSTKEVAGRDGVSWIFRGECERECNVHTVVVAESSIGTR